MPVELASLMPGPRAAALLGPIDAQLPAAMRLALGREVVEAVARGFAKLPAPAIALELPCPAIALQTLVLEERTRRVLERAGPVRHPAVWPLCRYLEMPRFGPHCLVDLLAAHAEATLFKLRPDTAPRPPIASVGKAGHKALWSCGGLDRLSALLTSEMPVSERLLPGLLIRADVGFPAPSLADLTRAYQAAGRRPPFRIAHAPGVLLAVAAGSVTDVETIAATATRSATSWGLVTVASVIERVRLLGVSESALPLARRVIAALPRVVWLDAEGRWFSLKGNASGFAHAVEKVFAVVDRVELGELAEAVAKICVGPGEIPFGALATYLAAVHGCRLDGAWIAPPPALRDVHLHRDEMMLMSALRAGSRMNYAELRRALPSLPPASISRVLRRSPLFVTDQRGRVRLIGQQRVAPARTTGAAATAMCVVGAAG